MRREGDRRGKEMWHGPSFEHLVPPILDPTVNDARTEIADRTASCPRGLESFLKVGLPFVLIGWINQPCLERAIEVLERRQLLERVQIPMVATLESRERLPVTKERLRTL